MSQKGFIPYVNETPLNPKKTGGSPVDNLQIAMLILAIAGALGLGVYFRQGIKNIWIALRNYVNERMRLALKVHFIYSEDEFFVQLEAAVMKAERRVDLTYFDNLPPKEIRTIQGQEYHNKFPDIVRRKQEVHFRRIVRENPAIIPWVEELIGKTKGQRNFSIACYPDKEPDNPNLDIITVQLVDDHITYLVSVGTQESSRAPRDIIVHSPLFNEVWSRYFNNLWKRSKVVLDRGAVQDGWQEIKSGIHFLKTE